MGQPIRIVDRDTDEPFVWLLVTEMAKEVWHNGLFDLYILYDDESESQIHAYEDLTRALENGCDIGIEVGHIPPLKVKTSRDIVLEQIKIQEEIQSAGFNIVECGNCGTTLLHKRGVESVDCFCGNMDVSDCPDLYYRGMENSEEFN